MIEIARSALFTLITGIASVAGLLVSLYSFRVKQSRGAYHRRLEWYKSATVSVAFGVLFVASVGFYAQNPPPNIQVFRTVHDFLHGLPAPVWAEGGRPIGLSYEVSFYPPSQGSFTLMPCGKKIKATVSIVQVVVDAGSTRVEWSIRSHGEPLPSEDNVVQNQVGVEVDVADEQWTPFERSMTRSPDDQQASGQVLFASLANQPAAVSFPDAGRHVRLSADIRGRGTPLWGIAVALSFCVLAVGIWWDPIRTIRSRMWRDFQNLQTSEAASIDEVLDGRGIEELSVLERERLDTLRAHFAVHRQEVHNRLVIWDKYEETRR